MYLSIDQSTSGTKAILFDGAGRAIAKAAREHRQNYSQPGWVEHDLTEIWSNVLAVVRELRETSPDALNRAKVLSITNQRETICVFDRVTGEPLHNAMVWQCRRGESICDAWREQGLEAHTRSTTGLRIDAYFSASKLAWMTQNKPEIASRLRDGSAVVGTIDAYLVHRMTGGKVFATDHTNASRTMLYDIGKLAWDSKLCDVVGVPIECLPEVRDSSGQYGTTDLGGVLPKPLPIAGVIGDSQASLFASRCYEIGQTKATLGTGTSIMTTVGNSRPNGCDGTVAAIGWTHAGRVMYAVEGIIHSSAATIEWLRKQLGLFESAAECERLANDVPDNGGVYLVPAFGGLGAPHWAPEARAAIVGLSAHSTKTHIARAAVESIAYQVSDALDLIRAESGIAPTSLRIDGGASKNRMLLQLIADLTGLSLEVATMADGSALGASMLGAIAIGEKIEPTDVDTLTIEPSADRSRVASMRGGWNVAVKQVLAAKGA